MHIHAHVTHISSLHIYKQTSTLEFDLLIHGLLINQHIPNKGCWDIKSNQKIVNMSKKQLHDRFHPTHSRHKKHIFWYITVISSHERYLSLSCIIMYMQGCKIRCSNMNNIRLKLVQLFLYIFRKRYSQMIGNAGVIWIRLKGNRQRVVHEYDTAVFMFLYQMCIAAITALGGQYAYGSSRCENLPFQFSNGNCHTGSKK
jgi:hypothetical protein